MARPALVAFILCSLSVAPLLSAPAEIRTPLRSVGAVSTIQQGIEIVPTADGFVAWWSTLGSPTRIAGVVLDRNLDFAAPVRNVTIAEGWFRGSGVRAGSTLLLAAECHSTFSSSSICLYRYDDRGALLGESVLATDGRFPELVMSPAGAMVFFVDQSSGTESRGVAIGLDASLKPDTPINLGTMHGAPVATAAEEGFFVAWTDPAIRIAKITDGSLGEVQTIASPAEEPVGSLSIAASAEGILLTAQIGRTLWARRVDRSDAWQVLESNATYYSSAKSLAIPGGFLTAWTAGGENYKPILHVATLRGQFFGSKINVSGGRPAYEFDLSMRGSEIVAAYVTPSDSRPGESFPLDVRARLLDSTGTPLGDDPIVSLGLAPQMEPAAVFDGAGHLIAWTERDDHGFWRIRAQRFGPDGESIGSSLEMPSRQTDQFYPAVAFNGGGYFIAWSEGPDGGTRVRGARIGLDGGLEDPEGLDLFGEDNPYPFRRSSVAWNGSAWVVVSSIPPASEEYGRVVAARRIDPSGVVLDAAPVEITSSVRSWDPRLSCGSGGCLLVWRIPLPEYQCQVTTCPGPPDILVGARIDSTLDLLDDLGSLADKDQPRRLMRGWTGFTRGVGFDVAWNDHSRRWMVVWEGPAGCVVEQDGVIGESVNFPLTQPMEGWGPYGTSISVIPEGPLWLVGWTERITTSPHYYRIVTTDAAGEEWQWKPRGWLSGLDVQAEVRLAPGTRPLALMTLRDPEWLEPRIVGRFVEEWERGRRRAVGR